MTRARLIVLVLWGILFVSAIAFAEKRAAARVNREPNALPSRNGKIKVGAVVGFDGLWGKSSSADVLAKGLGYSFGLSGQARLSGSWRVVLHPSYKFMRLGRPFDGSGQLQEPTPANLDQSMTALGIGVFGSYEVERGEEATAPVWWLDLGMEYIMPLSAEQLVSGSKTTISPGKGLLLVLGATADFRMGQSYDLSVSAQGFYNLAGSGGAKYFGARLLAGVTLYL